MKESVVVSVRLSLSEYKAAEAAAQERGEILSDFTRKAIKQRSQGRLIPSIAVYENTSASHHYFWWEVVNP